MHIRNSRPKSLSLNIGWRKHFAMEKVYSFSYHTFSASTNTNSFHFHRIFFTTFANNTLHRYFHFAACCAVFLFVLIAKTHTHPAPYEFMKFSLEFMIASVFVTQLTICSVPENYMEIFGKSNWNLIIKFSSHLYDLDNMWM